VGLCIGTVTLDSPGTITTSNRIKDPVSHFIFRGTEKMLSNFSRVKDR
jgi:hypothetical protein